MGLRVRIHPFYLIGWLNVNHSLLDTTVEEEGGGVTWVCNSLLPTLLSVQEGWMKVTFPLN